MPNFKVKAEHKPFIYIPDNVDFGKWETAGKAMDSNWQRLEKCGELARKAKQYIGQFFRVPCADGYAVYQVVNETPTKYGVQHCTGLGDDWADHHFGYGGSFPKKEVKRYIDQENGMRELFSKAKAKK